MKIVYKMCIVYLISFSIPLYAQGKDDNSQKIREELQTQIEETRKAYEARIKELETKMAQLQDSNNPEKEKETEEIDLEDIFKEMTTPEEETLPTAEAEKDTTTHAEETGVGAIERDVGRYDVPKFPWFPALLNPYMGLMIEVPARFTNQKGGFESVNQIEMREAELNIYSNIDPFIRAFALISGSDEVSIEEAYFLTSSLPYDLQIRGGKFFANLGRLNKIHTHDLPFLDQPLTMQNFLGNPEVEEDEEILLSYEPQYKGSGAEIIWLAPTNIFWRLTGGVYNEFTDRGPGSFYAQYLDVPEGFRFRQRNANDFSYSLGSRWFFELGDDHSIRIDTYGINDTPKSDLRRAMEIFAFTYRWYPLEYGLYKGMEWTSEIYANQERFLKGGINPVNQDTWGFYSYTDYKLDNRFSLSVVGGWSQFRFDRDAEAWQLGSALSYKPSERQRIRAQIDYIDNYEWKKSISNAIGLPAGDGNFWQFALQWTVVMGSHTHTYE